MILYIKKNNYNKNKNNNQKILKNNKGVEDGKTCAELVAYIYYKLGIFCNSPPIYTYSPCQYYCNRNLGFINGYKFKGRYIFSLGFLGFLYSLIKI